MENKILPSNITINMKISSTLRFLRDVNKNTNNYVIINLFIEYKKKIILLTLHKHNISFGRNTKTHNLYFIVIFLKVPFTTK